MKPTPTELALIAAALSKGEGDPSIRLAQAFELWQDAARLLASNETPRQPPDKRKIPLAVRLEQLMPDLTSDYRKKKFHDYLSDKCQDHPRDLPWDDAQNEAATRAVESMFGSGGVAEDSFADFHTWAAKKVHDARSEAGRTGAERKHANDHAKKEVKKRKRAKPEITHVGSEDALDAIANDSQRKGITLPD